ncbi:hypothetical protein [Ensifer adhaerens]|uniref:Uncharacterized protein n=1 Tax=Ensifer adhaerens TaxID=106592 RepID=A0A9Q9DEF4_ENSAD|nr:hypothetical protein [Ensifer adhaerens]USJ28360.1 hypothetical protein NE863_34790 [Ensifer adhaerens]
MSRQTLGPGQIDAAVVRSFAARLSSMALLMISRPPGIREQGDRLAVDFRVFCGPICGHRPFKPGVSKGNRFDLSGASCPPTNGAKYDTLAVDQSRVSIAWTVKLEPVLSPDRACDRRKPEPLGPTSPEVLDPG